MRLFFYSFISLLVVVPSLFAFQAHDQDLAYTHPAIVVKDGVSYISVQNVPAGTTLTSTSFWTPLLDTAPTVEVGDPPTTDPSDSNVSNLTQPDYNGTDEAEDSGSIFFGLSTRAAIDTKAIVGGLTIEGTENMLVMVRVKGPSMNLKNGTKLPNPKLEILKLDEDTGTYSTLLESLDFGDHTSSISYADRATGDNLEPVVVESLAPGTYSMRVKEENSQTGNANLEIYGIEGDSSTSKMFGISTRGYVGDKPMVGGLNISGTESKKVLIRVKGPSMTLKNATLLPNPKITVLKLDDTTGTYSELVVSLDYGDHSSSSAYADRATGNNLEPMIVETLEPGTYSIKVQDETGQSGNANLEVYEVE